MTFPNPSITISVAVKFGGGGIIVWGCFSGFMLGPLVSVKDNVDATVYKDILDKLDADFIYGSNFTFTCSRSI